MIPLTIRLLELATFVALLLLVWGAFSRLYQLEQKVNDHTFGQFKIDCPDPSEHMKFTLTNEG